MQKSQPTMTPVVTPRPDAERALVVLLGKALRLAGQSGRPVAASRLAAKAWWTLHAEDPQGAERINGVMHYLARLPEEPSDDAHPETKAGPN